MLKENEIKDAKTLAHIHYALVDSISPRIIRVSTAKEGWAVLQEEFQETAQVRLIKLNNLRREFENLKMKDGESVKDYSSKVMEVVNQMKIYGDTILDQRIVQKVLVSLTKDFDTII